MMADGLTQNSFFHMIRGFDGNQDKPVNVEELNNNGLNFSAMQSLNPNQIIH